MGLHSQNLDNVWGAKIGRRLSAGPQQLGNAQRLNCGTARQLPATVSLARLSPTFPGEAVRAAPNFRRHLSSIPEVACCRNISAVLGVVVVVIGAPRCFLFSVVAAARKFPPRGQRFSFFHGVLFLLTPPMPLAHVCVRSVTLRMASSGCSIYFHAAPAPVESYQPKAN